MFRLIRNSKGFTLVELMIVLAVLAVLAAVVIPNVSGYLGRGKERAWDADREILQSAVDAWRTDIRNRAGNPWPVLTSPTVPADLQPGPNPNQTTRGYIDIGALATAGYLKGTDSVRSAVTTLNNSTNSPSGSYGWFINSSGIVNAWADANEGGSYSSGETGFQTNIYP